MVTLRYKIKDIPAEGRVVDEPIARSLFAEALEGIEADVESAKGSVHLELMKGGGEDVFVRGQIKAQLTVPCAKCLGPALVSIDAPLKMTFMPDGSDEDVSDDPLDDADVATHDRANIEMEPIVREQIILALPISPRCTESCKGLCASCGQNRNERDCGHSGSEVPSALAIQLQKKLNLQPKG